MSSFDDDPLEDFIDRERDQIVYHHGNDLHWRSIVRQARAQRRSRFLGYAAGMTAAGLVIGGITYGAVLRDGPPPVTAATHDSTTANRSASAAAAKAAADAKAAARQLPVPKSFAVLSITNVGQGNIFVLGSSDCGVITKSGSAGRCPVLIGSTDSGRSWHLVSSIKPTSVPVPPSRGGDGSADNELSQVRFANTKVGWVFSPDVQYTTDGGRTFRPYGHLGQLVIDVETDGSQVIVTSVDRCAGPGCSPARHVARASISAAGATTEVGTGATGRGLGDLRVVFDATQPYVSPRWKSAPTSGFEPQRITASGLQPLGPLGATCGDPSEQDIIATDDPNGGLFAFCATPGAAMGSIGMGVFHSNNQGRSWTAVSSDALILVNAGPRSFAAANAHDVLAVSAGNQDTHGSMQMSHDGGKSWHSPASPPPMPTHGWAWVGAPGGTTFYAISSDIGPAYWKSEDNGETWTTVDLTS